MPQCEGTYFSVQPWQPNCQLSRINLSSDVNECNSDTSPCEVNQVCKNTAGSYLCLCTAGYVYNMINKTCDGKLTVTIVTVLRKKHYFLVVQ